MRDALSSAEIILDHQNRLAYLLTDEETLQTQLKNAQTIGEWVRRVLEGIKQQQGVWYGLKFITDASKQAALRKRLLEDSD